jgi:hypothetical protein
MKVQQPDAYIAPQRSKTSNILGYALVGGFIALASGALLPSVTANFSAVVSRLGAVLY